MKNNTCEQKLEDELMAYCGKSLKDAECSELLVVVTNALTAKGYNHNETVDYLCEIYRKGIRWGLEDDKD